LRRPGCCRVAAEEVPAARRHVNRRATAFPGTAARGTPHDRRDESVAAGEAERHHRSVQV